MPCKMKRKCPFGQNSHEILLSGTNLSVFYDIICAFKASDKGWKLSLVI